jgi:hypothetical protein
MAALEFSHGRQAPQTDGAERSPAGPEELETETARETLPEELPQEADLADAVEQAAAVPVDEDEYR